MKKTVVAATVLSSLIAFHSTACELHAGMGKHAVWLSAPHDATALSGS